MSSNVGGVGLLALGEISRAENKSRRVIDDANQKLDEAWEGRDAAIAEKNRLVFAAKSQIHLFRSRIEGRIMAEDELISALKAENPSHPLASREVVDTLADKYRIKAAYDPNVIKHTWASGVAPEGAIPIVDGEPGAIDGEPAWLAATPEEQLAWQEHSAMLSAAGLDGHTILDPARVTLAIAARQVAMAAIEQRLSEDSNKGFFGRMKKFDRVEVEADFERAKRHVVLLRDALVKAEEHASRQEKERLG